MAINGAHHDSPSTNVPSVAQRGAGVGSPGGGSTTLHTRSQTVNSTQNYTKEESCFTDYPLNSHSCFNRILTGLHLFLVHSNWNSLGQRREPHCSIPRTRLRPGDRVQQSKGRNLRGERWMLERQRQITHDASSTMKLLFLLSTSVSSL